MSDENHIANLLDLLRCKKPDLLLLTLPTDPVIQPIRFLKWKQENVIEFINHPETNASTAREETNATVAREDGLRGNSIYGNKDQCAELIS